MKKLGLVIFTLVMFALPFLVVRAISPENCAKIATSSNDCSKCSGYSWDYSTSSCIKNGVSKVSCGNIDGIPKKIPQLTSLFVSSIQVVVPIMLVIFGSIDLFKGLSAQKEEEIKKGQQILIKRLIIAGLIFFVIVIVKFVASVVADNSNMGLVECIDCFFSNSCK